MLCLTDTARSFFGLGIVERNSKKMKFRLAVLDRDYSYLNKMISSFQSKLSNKVELYAFTDENIVMPEISASRINVLLATTEFQNMPGELPSRCGFAYLVETKDITHYNDRPAICKYQSVESLYSEIIKLFADNMSNDFIIRGRQNKCPVFLFTSASGGVGTSTIAVATAKSMVSHGKTPIYINAESFGSSDIYFSGEGTLHFGDVIYSIKSKKTNLTLKLEAAIKRDISGVYFYSPPQNSLDIQELTYDEFELFFNQLAQMEFCDCIIADINLFSSKASLVLLNEAHRIIFVTDGSDVSNMKLQRVYDTLCVLEKNSDSDILSKTVLFYNKFSNKTGMKSDLSGLNSIGGIHKYEHMTTTQIVNKMVTDSIITPVTQHLIGGA